MSEEKNQKTVAYQKSLELGEKSIGKLMWKYFVPAFVGVVVYSLYNIVDRIFIGRGVGSLALSGLSAVFPIMLIVMAFGMLIGIGAGVNISIAMGQKDPDKAERILGNGFVLMILVSILVSIIGFIIKTPVLQMFGATEATIAYAQEYLNIILLGAVFQIIGFGMNNIIRSEGNARISMYSMLLSAGANLILDPIFIFVLDMGVRGAAYATIISMIGLNIWVLAHFTSRRAVNRLKMKSMKLVKDVVSRIFAVGMAPFSMQLAASFVMALYTNQLIKHGGDLAVGALGIIFSIANFLVMAMVAINMASQPIIGYNFGAKDYGRVKKTVRYGIIAASLIAVVSTIIVEVFPEPLVRLFNNNDPVLFDLSVNGMRIFALALPVVGFQIVAANFFQSIGKAKIATFLSLLRQLILLAPLLIILPGSFGLNGVWMATPLSDFGSAVITAIFLFVQLRKLGTESQ
ncbi:MAG: MATE family efflux transporter [Bacteroidetes bacterium]|jgi:putative MATE family efflux protein|nr:MATE family efflux transporter [Bacteroidota bacterium]MBT3751528.1 MATE family efflux transporter [Bacteroidota bacterium]MBT4398340.1 MATE family efflux transporter [Bacteroidota bacterium]MBT4409945.1 MATE family efflux transporter [Bacteroidota bacterium]MBT5427457.1 MATE family efflux transporter [Bacteroidota bacterium]